MFPLIELSVVFGVAGWVTYLQKSRPAVGLEQRPTGRALRRHKVTTRGRTASDADGAAVDYS